MNLSKVTLRQLRYLVALDDAGHFRKAAEMCDISQPSLSAQIQNLEDTLGVHLVERGRKGTALSPVGREICKRARNVLAEVQAIEDFAAGAQHGLLGTFRLGAKPTLGPYLLPHVVKQLHKQHPELSLYIRESAPRDLVHELDSGLHDLILTQLPITGTDVVTARLFREPLYLAHALDHPFADKETISSSDLSGQQVLSLSPLYHLHDQITQLCNDFGATVLRDYEGTSLDALRQMVGMNMGVSFLPQLYVQSEVSADSEIMVRPLQDRKIMRSVGLVWRKSSGRAPAYKTLADIVRKVVQANFPKLIVET